MHIFVTGATGFIGTAVVKELLSEGHQITGLSRTAQGADKLRHLGAKARVGQLDQSALLREAAADSDGVIHLAFSHGLAHMDLVTRLRLFAGALNTGVMSSFMRILLQTESRAIQALGSGLEGTGRPLIVTSGVLMLPSGKISTEDDNHVKDVPNRSFSENAALDLVPRRVRASVIRLSPTVHGSGDRGFIPYIIKAARKKIFRLYR